MHTNNLKFKLFQSHCSSFKLSTQRWSTLINFTLFFSCDLSYWKSNWDFRSSCPEVFCKKGVLKKFSKLTEKHLCQSFYFNKVAVLRPATLLKKRLWHRYFPVNFAKFLRTSIFKEHFWWLLLKFQSWYERYFEKRVSK